MKAAIKREIDTIVGDGSAALTGAGFHRERTGFWACPAGQLRWELEVVHEPGYGEGVFRLGWGVRVPGVAEILELEDLPGVEHATVGGDVGSLARRRIAMGLLCVESGSVGLGTRFLRGVRPEAAGVLTNRVREWTAELLEVLRPLTDHLALADFLGTYESRYGKIHVDPDNAGRRLPLIAALRALGGDVPAARENLTRWREVFPEEGSLGYPQLQAKYKRMAARIDKLA
ncbi:hypothetical protein Lfu02_03190 [Longispora fulva]|uniref:Uncharacterized protein n=1 Tax=Longispora fulva TaxID=619741 RepID=A0A8J7KF67_9ACTN|nr:hypothetical protein [Longispora fulva]MBG6135810.1 hypothetical protein [Longispora fulva]GIG55947.1 hypothetical protein Lfu02_03190 [Longispora fulva]